MGKCKYLFGAHHFSDSRVVIALEGENAGTGMQQKVRSVRLRHDLKVIFQHIKDFRDRGKYFSPLESGSRSRDNYMSEKQ